ncbi:hypothetical protein IE81DRAFT_348848 [Ceraceosorus guamensis]|uniref:Uncharacterized protein n=1 Tax=Ceraceosorus guamensis TaxID=1522189 RepID=A0A316VU13_9BASI|nr:hypothetical protein IE81DRAFT_348848 [Ceraceosorus guamensis]PWN40900.1 hypothetical protein IE81DRAFT_348848 [Ceraceosorus guamensis]
MNSSSQQSSIAEGATAAEMRVVCADVAKADGEGSAALQEEGVSGQVDVEQAAKERESMNIEFHDACDDLSQDVDWSTTDDDSELSFEDAEVGTNQQFADNVLDQSPPAYEESEALSSDSEDSMTESLSSESNFWPELVRRLMRDVNREEIGRQQAEEHVTALEEQLRGAGLVPIPRPASQGTLAERTAGRLQVQYDQVDREADLHVGQLMDLTIKVDELEEEKGKALADNVELEEKLASSNEAMDSLKKEVWRLREENAAGLARDFEAVETLERERQDAEEDKAELAEHIAQLAAIKQRDDAAIAELKAKVQRLEQTSTRAQLVSSGARTTTLPSRKHLPQQRSAPLARVLPASNAPQPQRQRPSALSRIMQLSDDAGDSSSMRSHEGNTYTAGPRSHSWFKWTNSGLRILHGSPNSSGAISVTANEDDFAGPDSDYSSSLE